MAGSFPTLSSGSVAMYPATIATRVHTRVHKFCNDTEQRWVMSSPLAEFSLTYTGLKTIDYLAIESFFEIQKGKFDSWDLTIDGQTYNFCVFEQDELRGVETSEDSWDVSIKFRQKRRN